MHAFYSEKLEMPSANGLTSKNKQLSKKQIFPAVSRLIYTLWENMFLDKYNILFTNQLLHPDLYNSHLLQKEKIMATLGHLY